MSEHPDLWLEDPAVRGFHASRRAPSDQRAARAVSGWLATALLLVAGLATLTVFGLLIAARLAPAFRAL